MSAEWVTAVATIVYTIGTFLLWRVTSKALQNTRDAVKLSLFVEYFRTQIPAANVGHPWETREAPQQLEELQRREAKAMRRVFPDLFRELEAGTSK